MEGEGKKERKGEGDNVGEREERRGGREKGEREGSCHVKRTQACWSAGGEGGGGGGSAVRM